MTVTNNKNTPGRADWMVFRKRAQEKSRSDVYLEWLNRTKAQEKSRSDIYLERLNRRKTRRRADQTYTLNG